MQLSEDLQADEARLIAEEWVSGPETALTFNAGEVTILIGRATYKNASQALRTDLADIKGAGARAAIGAVNGKPALIIQPHTDCTKSNVAWVEYSQRGLDINVLSTRLGTKALLAIADSMQD